MKIERFDGAYSFLSNFYRARWCWMIASIRRSSTHIRPRNVQIKRSVGTIRSFEYSRQSEILGASRRDAS